MARVELKMGQETRAIWSQALAGAGFKVVSEGVELLVADASAVDSEAVRGVVDHVLGGGRLLVGGAGPLLPALHLYVREAGVGTEAEPAPGSGLEPVTLREAVQAVTGVGYALYRCGTHCVALGGPRGDGWVVYVAGTDPDDLALSCIRWLRDR